ncbi:unnamed protein product [Aphis gossypii]|uniref:Uncharacterized protein n=1 Tax=Aphis gossypii TaxID=80765 RepID=A0A9P0JH66_APHGO|nr:unnamed protein product [Aphis gossypii]
MIMSRAQRRRLRCRDIWSVRGLRNLRVLSSSSTCTQTSRHYTPSLFSIKTCTTRLMTFDWTYSPHPEKEGGGEGHFHWCPSRWKERCRIYTDGVINWLRPTGFAVLLDLISLRVYDLNDFLLSAWSSQPRRNTKRLIIVHNDV